MFDYVSVLYMSVRHSRTNRRRISVLFMISDMSVQSLRSKFVSILKPQNISLLAIQFKTDLFTLQYYWRMNPNQVYFSVNFDVEWFSLFPVEKFVTEIQLVTTTLKPCIKHIYVWLSVVNFIAYRFFASCICSLFNSGQTNETRVFRRRSYIANHWIKY